MNTITIFLNGKRRSRKNRIPKITRDNKNEWLSMNPGMGLSSFNLINEPGSSCRTGKQYNLTYPEIKKLISISQSVEILKTKLRK
jgi:hypothetical protein